MKQMKRARSLCTATYRARLGAVILIGSLFVTSPAAADTDWNEVGMWTGAGFASLLYTPLKFASCMVLGLGGGLSYAVTIPMDNTDLSEQIIQWGYGGDWMIRPEHLTLDETPEFIGFDDEVRFIE